MIKIKGHGVKHYVDILRVRAVLANGRGHNGLAENYSASAKMLEQQNERISKLEEAIIDQQQDTSITLRYFNLEPKE